MKANALERAWLNFVHTRSCVICSRFEPTGLPVEAHHVAEGSGLRSHFSIVPLCGSRQDGGHHRGAIGLHGPQGIPWFLKFYRPPGESEFGLLVWFLEDLAGVLTRRGRM